MDQLSIEKLIATSRYYFSLPMPSENNVDRAARKPRKDTRRARGRRARLAQELPPATRWPLL